MPAPVLLGLTGGIGSGKSTVAAALGQTHDAVVVDADAISRGTTAASGSALAAIARAFGEHVIGADGALDRAVMRELVYRDANARQRLEAIIHPLVAHEIDHQAEQATRDGAPLIVFDVPLLVEGGARWRARVDRVMVIDCDVETQVQRVMARNLLPRDEVERIVAAQAGRPLRLASADVVVFNGKGTDLAQLRTQVSHWAQRFGL